MTLAELYDKIPEVKGCTNCGQCCQLNGLLLSMPEAKRILNRITNDGEGCKFLINNRCSVYENRPFICRMFGACRDSLICPKGAKADKPLTEKQADKLFKIYREEFIKDLEVWI